MDKEQAAKELADRVGADINKVGTDAYIEGVKKATAALEKATKPFEFKGGTWTGTQLTKHVQELEDKVGRLFVSLNDTKELLSQMIHNASLGDEKETPSADSDGPLKEVSSGQGVHKAKLGRPKKQDVP